MTQLGIRVRAPFPPTYKDFQMVRHRGRVYGVPGFLDPAVLERSGKLYSHPAVLSASTREELESRIDRFDINAHQPQMVGAYQGFNLIRYCGAIHGVPTTAGQVNLDVEEDRRRAGVILGKTLEEVEERIRRVREAVPVEFAGWLPVYEYSGNCGQHPQFKHTTTPPSGYRFTYSAPPKKTEPTRWEQCLGWCLARLSRVTRTLGVVVRPLFAVFRSDSEVTIGTRLRVLVAMIRLFIRLLRGGGKIAPVLRFLQSRHYQSQLLIGECSGLVFLTSMPYTYNQNPWVIEIEDPTTLFYPLIENGQTCDHNLADSPYFPIVKTLLEADECKGIVTHMKSTAQMVSALFQSEIIQNKIHYMPLGIRLPERWQHHEEDEGEPLNILFINSWCQVTANFYVRGGLDVLEAFAILRKRYPRLRLTLRTNLPGLDEHFHEIMESGWVRVINRFLSAEEMEALLLDSHIFLLPAARVHILSLLQAMSYGLAVVTSDGWGIEEYVEHDRNGLIVKGRYGKTSWVDAEASMLREDYEPMFSSNPQVVQGLVESISRLIEDRQLRQRLGRTARQDVQTIYSLERWNRGLKEVFDQALAPTSV